MFFYRDGFMNVFFMNVFAGLGWSKKLFGSKQVHVLGLVLIAALASTGCHKASPAATQTAADQNADTNQAATVHAPVYQPPTAVAPAAPTQTGSAPDLNALDRALMHWVMANRRVPKNFGDFAATAGVAIPPPPAGQQYVIDKTMHIKLVNQ
jgi:hypothetical protein